ncbi:hypothetical protein GGTG_01575 [Gaeumannomyces tritici R3-111a-1]|uniref:Heterokaryon incompatibility domain-containing protein n=1 Tax=Gaeumannomyces tritici (strain R3-111a-1) TaxID=644352 RepID=J3NJZ3_GAET3|nr:hypothetical protein GGTG_01575 [Gaeumannomyces tritici R3-111a-1]EJT81597.1 hypothetical protein GGTG_01575 [Gaeumannomyces tritici R3-111a-1]
MADDSSTQDDSQRSLCFALQACDVGAAGIRANEHFADPRPGIDRMVFGGRRRPLQLDMRWVRRWIDIYEQDHGHKCEEADVDQRGDRFPLIRFVDVKKKCIVTLKDIHIPDYRYMALSYVWGGPQELRLITLNKDRLAKPGSLVDGEYGKLPQTIKDAIVLTDALAIDYLWIDALCILQDGDSDKGVQIAAMAQIMAFSSSPSWLHLLRTFTAAFLVSIREPALKSNAKWRWAVPHDDELRYWMTYQKLVATYTRRTFSYRGEVFDAFRAVLQGLSDLGRGETFTWGLPRSHFDEIPEVLCFEHNHSPLQIERVRELSMAYEGRIRALPTWKRFQDQPVTPDDLARDHPRLIKAHLKTVPETQVTFFWTSSAFFTVVVESDAKATRRAKIKSSDGSIAGSMEIATATPKSEYKREFIVLASRRNQFSEPVLRVLLIEWGNDGAAYRIDDAEISEAAWLREPYARKLIPLR